jgi:hypothetical protein
MKQYQDYSVVVAEKLETITTTLNNLDQWCAEYGLRETNLPRTLRRIFQNFERYAMYS